MNEGLPELDDPSRRMVRAVALAFVGIAAASALLCLSGWVFGVPVLRGFGFPGLPSWPLTAIGYLALSLGYAAAILARPRLSLALLVVPLLIGSMVAYESFTGTSLGLGERLFADAVSSYAAPAPGRPGANPTTMFFLLAAAGCGMRRRSGAWTGLGGVAATAALVFAAAAALLVGLSDPGGTRDFLSTAAPSAIAATALITAFVLLHSDLAWLRRPSRGGRYWLAARTLLPAAIILPLVPRMLDLVAIESGWLTPVERELLGFAVNFAIITAVVYWAVTQVARGEAATVRLSQALDRATVVLTTADGRISHWSRGCEELYGWTAAEACGQHKYALLRSRCRIDPRACDRLRPAAGEALELEETCRDGRTISVIEARHRVGTSGDDGIVVLTISDATERLAAVDALRAGEERLAAATSVHELGVFEWDFASGRLQWSPGTELRLGLVPGSMPDFDSWARLVDPDDYHRVHTTFFSAADEGADKVSFRYRFKEPNGSVRAVEGSARLFYNPDGTLFRTVGVILDITAREEREEALCRREAQLRSILDTVPDPMLVIDEAGTIIQFSAAAEQLWGYSADRVLGQSVASLAPPEQREGHLARLRDFVRTGEGIVGEVIPALAYTAAGERVPIEIRTGVAQDGGMLLTLFVRDLRVQQEAEARISELSEQIAHVSRQSEMSELAADIAHELNQPLAATANYLAATRMMLRDGGDPERVSELLRLAGEQIQRTGDIIRRVRAFMTGGDVDMRVESVGSTVRDAAELVLIGTARFNIRVTYDLDPAASHVFADRIQVQQVLVNLMRNAMEALRSMDEGDRQLAISSRRLANDMVEIAVTDNGPGIPVQVLEQLFSRFTTTKASDGGMGIGLSISRRIIEAHGGMLTGENRSEGGAAFRFTLPAVEQGEIDDQNDLHRRR